MTDTSGAPWLKYQQPSAPAAAPAADANPGPWSKYQTAKSANPPPQEKSVSGVKDTSVALSDDPNKEYGEILPFAINKTTGKRELAFPEIIRAPVAASDRLLQGVRGQRPQEMGLNGLPGSQGMQDMLTVGGTAVGPGAIKAASREAPAVADIARTALTKPVTPAETAALGALKDAKPTLPNPVRAEPRTGVQGMRDAGYVLTPETASEKPGAISSALSGWSGDLKSQQLASVKNQKITQSLAARDLGLTPDTVLTPDVLNAVRAESGQAYKAARNAVPEITPTPEFKKAVDTFGGDTDLLSKHFPKSTENKDVDALRAEMRSMGTVPTDVVVDKIRVLRADATQNFKALGSPEKWRLAMAQRDAANSLDDLLEHSIQNAPKHFEGKVKEAGEMAKEAQTEIADAQAKLSAYQVGGKTFDIPFAEKRLQLAQERLAAAEESQITNAQRLVEAKDPNSNIANISNEYKKARTRIAKTYDYEAAVNPKTGEISPRALAALAKKGKPLTGGARMIADAALTAPKVMRVPSEFGGAKELSVLDFAGTMGALASHHPAVAGAIVGRPLARHAMLSDTYQNLMVPKSKQILSALGQTPPDSGEILRVLGQTDAP